MDRPGVQRGSALEDTKARLLWDRAQIEEGGNGEQSQMRLQAVRTASTRREESLLQSMSIKEQLWEQKKVPCLRSQATKEESPKHG